jgi:hypothetical protein
VSMSMPIFIKGVCYSTIHILLGLNIKIVFTFFNIIILLISMILTNFVIQFVAFEIFANILAQNLEQNFHLIHRGKCRKNMHDQINSRWKTQSTCKIKWAHDCWICVVTFNLVPWKMLTPSTQKTMNFSVISFWLKIPSNNKNSITQNVRLFTLDPSTTCTIDHNNEVHTQLLTTYTCINN